MRVKQMLNGSRLREARKSKGLTQEKLGDLIGVGKSAICCYEKETRNPTLEAVIEMMHVFGVSADYLLGSDFLIKTVDKDNNIQYVAMTKEEIIFIEELKKNKMVYDILLQDPKRGADLVKKEIG
ncbi:MAG: helix-turn-helix transcriptional regulator [Firmicutes bacterium]|nr:helix-turn-helix transcriptional regulator [Bacillota bacterium]